MRSDALTNGSQNRIYMVTTPHPATQLCRTCWDCDTAAEVISKWGGLVTELYKWVSQPSPQWQWQKHKKETHRESKKNWKTTWEMQPNQSSCPGSIASDYTRPRNDLGGLPSALPTRTALQHMTLIQPTIAFVGRQQQTTISG